MDHYDAIVLGLGAAGSAALYQLASRGVRALGIDRFSPPHAFGSSGGETRITRLAIGEGAHYTPLAIRSQAIWRELEAASGANLITTNGGLIISSARDHAAFHGASFFPTTLAAARANGITHELLDAGEIRGRFPPFMVGDGEVGYFEEGAGFVRPEACIAAQLAAAEARGATIARNEAVLGFEARGDGVIVATKACRYGADRLVIAAGPWLPELLAPQYARYFKVFREVQYWFDVSTSHDAYRPDRFPVFIWELPEARGAIYGFPAIDGPGGGFKIGGEQFGAPTTAPSANRQVSAEEAQSQHARCVAPFFRGAGSRCVRSAVCLYTVTDDFGFVVDRHPDFERVIIASPCSGHGFKHSAALGEAIADLVIGVVSRFDLSPFGFARLLDRQGGELGGWTGIRSG